MLYPYVVTFKSESFSGAGMGDEKGVCAADSIAILCRFFCKFDVHDRAKITRFLR